MSELLHNTVQVLYELILPMRVGRLQIDLSQYLYARRKYKDYIKYMLLEHKAMNERLVILRENYLRQLKTLSAK